MKKLFLTIAVFAISAVYVYQQHMSGGGTASASQIAAAPAPTTTQQPTTSTSAASPTATKTTPTWPTKTASSQPPATTPTSNTAPASTPPPAPKPKPKPKGQYVDGTYTGKTVDAYYGYVQVRATISGGKLTDVAFLQYPNTHSTSVYINRQAMPYLKQEAIQAQSANVSGVSGASATSMGFVQSLGSALAQAKA